MQRIGKYVRILSRGEISSPDAFFADVRMDLSSSPDATHREICWILVTAGKTLPIGFFSQGDDRFELVSRRLRRECCSNLVTRKLKTIFFLISD